MCLLKESSIESEKIDLVLKLGIDPTSFDKKFIAFTSKYFWESL
jgi:hypothetical protein